MVLGQALERIGFLFYAVNPRKHSYATIEEVPNFVIQVTPFFLSMVLVEQCILLYQRKPTLRINDGFASTSHGILEEFSKAFIRGWTLAAYIYIYNNWKIATLPWDSLWTWVIVFTIVDFIYYWAHRACHEINFLWATHQVHHSSEDYNLSTSLRIPVFQLPITSVFYLPMACFIPPSTYLVHYELNLLYQFWIHTEVIKTLGPLEYVLNTPSHHRVHHGRNRYCIDKNFGSVLIIWDRLFGTFEPEGEKIVYGLTHPLNSFEPIYGQLCHYIHMYKTFWEMKGFRNKMSVLFKGPGWYPGKPWHGNIEDVPNVKAPVHKYDPYMSAWSKLYILCHFTLLTLGFLAILMLRHTLSSPFLYTAVLYEVLSLSVLGKLCDHWYWFPLLEILRLAVFIVLDLFLFPITSLVQLLPGILRSITVISVRGMYLASFFGYLASAFGCFSFTSNTL